ncbi:unnamed protein product, partial [Scytosiphon promiscuus]
GPSEGEAEGGVMSVWRLLGRPRESLMRESKCFRYLENKRSCEEKVEGMPPPLRYTATHKIRVAFSRAEFIKVRDRCAACDKNLSRSVFSCTLHWDGPRIEARCKTQSLQWLLLHLFLFSPVPSQPHELLAIGRLLSRVALPPARCETGPHLRPRPAGTRRSSRSS